MKIQRLKRYTALFGATLMIAGVAIQAFPISSRTVHAAQITTRTLTLQAGAAETETGPTADGIPDGGSQPGGTVNHLFTFTPGTGGQTLGSIKFQYCTTAAPVPLGTDCIAPAGIDVNGATIGNQSGEIGFTGMIKSNETDGGLGALNTVVIQRTTAAATAATPAPISYRLDNVLNPNVPMTFFVRISMYPTLDATGPATDTGTVAAATSTQIKITGTMPESLVFCAGKTVTETNGVPDCATVSTGDIAFDRLFSPTDTALATSQMAASTNAGTGYAITVNGPTLMSGTNSIAGVATTDYSKHGVAQFGMNVVLNDATNTTDTQDALGNPNPGPDMTTMPAGYAPSANPAPTTDNINYNATAGAGYDTNGLFTFNNNATVATSNNIASNSQIYTASYIVNVPGNQPAGSYSTTLTYICTATF